MVQVKVYGLADKLNPIKSDLSHIIHTALIEIIKVTPEKKFQRFFPLEAENFYYPQDRSDNYLVIEIIMFEGRSIETKKQLLHQLMENIHKTFDISLNDIEITIFETAKSNWGIRGTTGDELNLNYKVEV
ncbi:tautomerase family protein [Nostoc sp. FACHB-87]|uniref:tautomerase family protein n=1 Tax=Nostocales TaxID=1161 RepID=UPI00168813EC|nr:MULTISPECIES: tautomerase family protein [Nostocales]MBD2297331.1 tautomerase family protein [Nostoc sp. FACHB-190]MBD2452929.1 tautomerase family protein [Nostoc sp. FACHB-87]MBD2474889.1 tautomerase family protein [Anabaena sp. FACHB-83]MBD2492280.1 tautomerase family protein [Aulosira sp. FACHB-615]